MKKKKKGKQSAAGEAKKPSKTPRVGAKKSKVDVIEAQDHKRGNIGSSGQGTHRGRVSRSQPNINVTGQPQSAH